LLCRKLGVEHQLPAPGIHLLAEITQGIVQQRLFIGPETAQFIQRIINTFGNHLQRGAGYPLNFKQFQGCAQNIFTLHGFLLRLLSYFPA